MAEKTARSLRAAESETASETPVVEMAPAEAAAPETQPSAPEPVPAAPAPTGKVHAVGMWRALKHTPPHAFLAASRLNGWSDFDGIHENTYDEGIVRVLKKAPTESVPGQAPPTGKLPVEAHWAQREMKPNRFHAVRAYFDWPIGIELTDLEFDTAVTEALGAVIR